MTRLKWDQVGERLYETGVDHGVLYIPNTGGDYVGGVPWNGLTTVTESPSGAEATPQYADNIKYLNLVAAEEFGGTIEAFTYPDEFEQCDGTASPVAGVAIGQQTRKTFGLCYRTLIGNDLQGTDYGFKIHLVWGALAAPSEKARTTVNDSPEALALSWEFTTTAVEVGEIEGTMYKPSATLTINSTLVDADALNTLLDILYGTEGAEPRLPLPAEVFALFSGTVTSATPTAPTYNSTTKVITIPTIPGVIYKIDGVTKTGTVTITQNEIVTAIPAIGYSFPGDVDTDWSYTF